MPARAFTTQACILLIFNEADSYTFKDMMSMLNLQADELKRLGIVPAPWTVFVPEAGAEVRVKYATLAAMALLLWYLIFLTMETYIVESDLQMPLSLRVCQLGVLDGALGARAVFIALAVFIVPTSVVLIARAFKRNINWPALVFLLLAYNVWMIVLQACA